MLFSLNLPEIENGGLVYTISLYYIVQRSVDIYDYAQNHFHDSYLAWIWLPVSDTGNGRGRGPFTGLTCTQMTWEEKRASFLNTFNVWVSDELSW